MRLLFGGNTTVLDDEGVGIEGAVGTVWTAETGGTRVTDLQNLNGGAIDAVTTLIKGKVPQFRGPDATRSLWLDFGQGRFLSEATDYDDQLGAAVAALQALLAGAVQGDAATLAERLAAIEASIANGAASATYA